jgi:hypothetical protein
MIHGVLDGGEDSEVLVTRVGVWGGGVDADVYVLRVDEGWKEDGREQKTNAHEN